MARQQCDIRERDIGSLQLHIYGLGVRLLARLSELEDILGMVPTGTRKENWWLPAVVIGNSSAVPWGRIVAWRLAEPVTG